MPAIDAEPAAVDDRREQQACRSDDEGQRNTDQVDQEPGAERGQQHAKVLEEVGDAEITGIRIRRTDLEQSDLELDDHLIQRPPVQAATDDDQLQRLAGLQRQARCPE